MPKAVTICSGLIERIGSDASTIIHKRYVDGEEYINEETLKIKDHANGLKEVAKLLIDPAIGVIKDPDEIHVVGHRVVHGGENFSDTQIITEEVKEKIIKLFPLAPLHNPPNYLGIEVSEKIFKNAKQIAVFDTAFHQTMPPVAYRIAIPNEYYTEHRIRAYGFHGTSHKYVSEKAIEYLQKKESKIITIHLGNGCSMSAILNGKCIDHSMGLGPMNGLIMGTRAGDIDQSVIFYLVNQLGYPIEEINHVLNKKSGMLGLTGFSDMRDVTARYNEGDLNAILAYEMYGYHIKKYIGSFTAVLNGLDAIVFTGGVGENDALVRSMSTKNLTYLGIELDEVINKQRIKGTVELNTKNATVKILKIPTNEELEIANQCYALMQEHH
jgi:acetate kinase